MTRHMKLAIAALTGALAIGGGAVAASAATSHDGYGGDACATGILSEYCGAQVNSANQAITVGGGYGQQLFARSYRDGDPSQQFFWQAYQGNNSQKLAIFAPRGVVTNEIIAQVGGRILLVPAPVQVTNNDLWTFTSGDWVNDASGDAIGVGPNCLLVPVAPPTTNNWVFETP
jgi:hypothetical protein